MKMQDSLTPLSVLGPQADDERQRIQKQFESGVSARETVLALCALADNNVQQVFSEVLHVHSTPSEGLCLVALGGYGRRLLFPYSDLDILFLFGSEKAEQTFRPLISDFSRTLWDPSKNVNALKRTTSNFTWPCWTAASSPATPSSSTA
jgi:UTP:GlnB (protein PII) uridylyltransferase